MSDTDRLLAEAMLGPPIESDIPNRLLAEFQRGYPLSKLRLLLHADNHNAVAAGVWIASELGGTAKQFFRDIIDLIKFPNSNVRFFVLDYLLSTASADDHEAVAAALDLMSDQDANVRWKVLVLAATVSASVIVAVQETVSQRDPFSSKALGLRLLRNPVEADVVAALHGDDHEVQGYAAAAAVRVASTNVSPLKHALQLSDVTIRQFAEDMAQRAGILPTA